MFWKKKKMIDVRELQRRGVLRIPRKGSEVVTNRDGFVEIGGKSDVSASSIVSSTSSSDSDALGFMDVSSGASSAVSSGEGYSKREVDLRIEKLDSLIYKLEQRIEVLERKAGVGGSLGGGGSSVGGSVGSSVGSSVGVAGW